MAVFPHSFVFTDAHTNYIAVGGNGDLSLGNLERRFAGLPSVGDDRRPFGVLSARDLLARFTRSPDQLVAEFGGDALVVGGRGRVGRRSGVCCV